MSYSTASACRPEITRRPYMSAPRRSPSATIAPISSIEHPRVRAPVDLVDHDARQNRNEDACHLGGDREERRDGKRNPVRAQESEQPAERAPAAPRSASELVVRHGFVGYGSTTLNRGTERVPALGPSRAGDRVTRRPASPHGTSTWCARYSALPRGATVPREEERVILANIEDRGFRPFLECLLDQGR